MSDFFCDNRKALGNLRIKIDSPKCEKKFEGRLSSLINIPICPFLFWASLPYLTILKNGGGFPFKKQPVGIPVQCSSKEGACVEINREKLNSNVAFIRMEKTKGFCDEGHKKGDKFFINLSNTPFCFDSLSAIFTGAFRLLAEKESKSGEKKIQVRCAKCGAIISLEL